MLHLKFKPQILPQIVAFKHIKTHQTGEVPHFVTFFYVFPLQNGEATKNLVRVKSGSGQGPIRFLSGSGQGPVRVKSGSGQSPVRVWSGSCKGLIGVWLGPIWVQSGYCLIVSESCRVLWGPIEVQLGSCQGPVSVRLGFKQASIISTDEA